MNKQKIKISLKKSKLEFSFLIKENPRRFLKLMLILLIFTDSITRRIIQPV